MRSSFEVTSTSVGMVILILRTTYATISLCAPVAQLAEATDSKPVQCEFESHQGHNFNTPLISSFTGGRVFCISQDIKHKETGHPTLMGGMSSPGGLVAGNCFKSKLRK